MKGAECSTYHLLLRFKVSFQIRRKRRPRGKKPPKKLDVSQTKHPDVVSALQSELSKRLEHVTFCKGKTEENWASLELKLTLPLQEKL
jgi:hypothetical protein